MVINLMFYLIFEAKAFLAYTLPEMNWYKALANTKNCRKGCKNTIPNLNKLEKSFFTQIA
jgi:hypothetical protein